MNESYKIDGFEFLKRLEEAWEKKENEKPLEEQRKYNQSLLAADIDKSPSQVSRWSNKNIGCPSIQTLVEIKEALNCSIDYLLGLDEKENKIENCEIKDLFDTLKEVFLYDMRNPHRNIDFEFDCISLPNTIIKSRAMIVFNTNGDSSEYNAYFNMIREYERTSKSFEYLDETQKEMLITNLINKYRNQYYSELPFK